MAFEDMPPRSQTYINALTANVIAGTHKAEFSRFSGDVSDTRSRIVQPSAGSEPEFVLYMEGYGAGDDFMRLVVKGFLEGGWVTSDTWEGKVTEKAVETYKAS